MSKEAALKDTEEYKNTKKIIVEIFKEIDKSKLLKLQKCIK